MWSERGKNPSRFRYKSQVNALNENANGGEVGPAPQFSRVVSEWGRASSFPVSELIVNGPKS